MVKPLKICRLSSRSASLVLVLTMLAAFLSGCVSDKDVEEASRQRDEYRDQLQTATLSNGRLSEQITEAYQACADLSTQLALNAAMGVHTRYTADLGRRRPAVETATTTSRPAAAATATRPPRASAGTSGSGGSGSSRGSGTASQGGGAQSGGGGSSGGSARPPAGSRGTGGGGAIDWGE